MASRVYKAGTIITRTKDLLDAGVLKTKPLWFDVIEANPPFSINNYNNPPKPGKPPITNITSHKPNHNLRQAVSLFDTHKTVSSTKTKIISDSKKEITNIEKGTVNEEKVEMSAAKSSTSRNVRQKKDATERLLDFLNEVEKQDKK